MSATSNAMFSTPDIGGVNNNSHLVASTVDDGVFEGSRAELAALFTAAFASGTVLISDGEDIARTC